MTPIKTGSIVTAYNKRAKLLHRGVVLSKGPLDSNKFLIQFERKELGFEFCMDVEIATHGVKDVLLPANPRALYGHQSGCSIGIKSIPVGELAYGSTYGTILNFNKGLSKEKLRNFYSGKDFFRVLSDKEKAVEKEIIVRLMFMMESSLKRKARILKTIENFNDVIGSCEKRSHESSSALLSKPCNESFREYLKWLHDSLASTNNVIEACLSYLQIMYGRAYSSGIKSSGPFHLADAYLPPINTTDDNSKSDNRIDMIWAKSLEDGCINCGLSITNLIQAERMNDHSRGIGTAESKSSDDGCEGTNTPSQDLNLHGCLSHASSLLLATELSRKSIWECRNDKLFSGSIIRSTFTSIRKSLKPLPLKKDIPMNLVNITRARDLGFQALTEALSMLEGELDYLTQM